MKRRSQSDENQSVKMILKSCSWVIFFFFSSKKDNTYMHIRLTAEILRQC